MSNPAFDDDHRAHLARAMRSFLFANRRDGSLTGWPMTPLWRDDAYVYFNTYRSSAKARVMVRAARVGLLVPSAPGGLARPPEALPLGRAALQLADEGIEVLLGERLEGGRMSGHFARAGGWAPVSTMA